MNSLPPIQPPPRPPSPFESAGRKSLLIPEGESAGSETGQFVDLLAGKVSEVNEIQSGADDMVHSLLTGGDVNEAEVLTAVQKADLAFRMLLQIRNKLMDAYREVQRIQI